MKDLTLIIFIFFVDLVDVGYVEVDGCHPFLPFVGGSLVRSISPTLPFVLRFFQVANDPLSL
jgi:hypothetical protein